MVGPKQIIPPLVVAAILGGIGWISAQIGSLATREFHKEDMAPIERSIENIETAATVQRLVTVLNARCGGNTSLEGIIQEQLQRYTELTGRTFNVGRCEGGLRVQ